VLRPPRNVLAPSPPLTRREVLLAMLVAVLLSVVMHWPLPLHMSRDLPRDIGDPLVQAWQVAWGGHALLHQPLDYFQSNMFWPLKNSLAFSEALAGYAPAGTIGGGVASAVFRYNLLFLFAYALCFVGVKWSVAVVAEKRDSRREIFDLSPCYRHERSRWDGPATQIEVRQPADGTEQRDRDHAAGGYFRFR